MKPLRRSPSSMLMLASLTATPLIAQQPAVEPPAPTAIQPSLLPVTQDALLPNGVKLVVLSLPRQPVLAVTLSVPAGSAFDPENHEGTADLLAGLLTRGAGTRSAAAVASAIETVGGSLSAAAGPDALTMQVDVLSDQAPFAFGLLADAALQPTLPADELETLRARSIASLESGLADPASLGGRVFLLGSYRGHPYGRQPTPGSVRAITRADLVSFHRARFRPGGALLVVVGNITLPEARRLALASFGRWKGLRPAPLPAVMPGATTRRILLVHQGGAQDAQLLIGTATTAGADSAYYAAAVLNRILGEGRSHRLSRALGRDHLWATSVSSAFLRTARLGVFRVTAQVPAEAADSAIRETLAQFALLRTELVPIKELERARDAVTGTFALRLQTASQLASAITEARLLGLPPAYLTGFRLKATTIGAGQIRAQARRTLGEDGLTIVVVGDAARLYRPLAAIAPVQIYASDGRSLTPEEIEPRSVALAYDLGQLPLRPDSLVIVAQGQPIGMQITQVRRGGDSVVYTERSTIGNALAQTTTVVFDSGGRMRRLNQVGRVRGQDTRIVLDYTGGKVKGTALVVGRTGPHTLTVDTVVSGVLVDDNAVQALVPALPLALNTRWTFDVFASGENLVRPMSLTVADLVSVTVPAGTFETFRVDLDGAPQRVSYFVTRQPPHRIVRLTIANTPVEFLAVPADSTARSTP